MNLLVTGGCGFIGSAFINYIFKKNVDINIINIDALYYCARVNNVEKSIQDSDRYTFIHGNITSKDLLRHILSVHKVSHVIHFAAQSHVQNSFTNALEYTFDNIVGTHTLLESCREYGKLQLFIHVSTDEVYGESMFGEAILPKGEESVLCPTNPYAATKASAELLAMSYYHSFKMPIIISRGNNVYGPGQYPEKLIPLFIYLLSTGQKVTIQGDGHQLRSFLHINDVVRAFSTILEKGQIGEIYNIGGDQHYEYTVYEIAKKLIRLIQNTCNYDDWITYIPDRPFNDKRYFISNVKLRKLGWDPLIDIDSGLCSIIYNTIPEN
jgi:UDP-glucose 4,6-dehydratase